VVTVTLNGELTGVRYHATHVRYASQGRLIVT